MLLNTPFVQQQITSFAVKYLKEKLNTEVIIEKSHIDLRGRVSLENVYVADLNKDTLLSASTLAVGVEMPALFRRQLVFSTLHLSDFQFYLTKENPEAPLNLQFVIDAFKSKEEKEPSKINLRINSILMREGRLTYDVLSEPETLLKFNRNHIDIHDFDGTFAVKQLTNDSLNIDIRNLSFAEKSGFSLEKLTLKVAANKTHADFTNFAIHLPETELKLDNVSSDYNTEQERFMEKAEWNLKILPSRIKLNALAAFVPAFEKFSDQIDLTASLKGTLNDFRMEYLTLSSGESMNLSANMQMRDVLLGKEAFVLGKVEHLFIKAPKIMEIANNISKDNIKTPELIMNLGDVRFQGDVSGYFDDLVAYGNFSTNLGRFSTDLMMGYRENLRTFKGSVKTTDFELGKLLNKEELLGNITFKADMDARLTPGNSIPTGFVKGLIEQVGVRDYTYNNIEIDGNFSNAAFEGKVSIDDPNGKLYAEGLVNLRNEIPVFNLLVQVEHFRPGALNLSEKYKNSELSFVAQANIEGEQLDDAYGYLHVNNLDMRNAGEDFFLRELMINVSGLSPERKLTIHSDIINGEIVGSIYFETLGNDVKQIASMYLPVFVESINGVRKNNSKNKFTGNLVIENTQPLTNVLNLPATVLNQANLLTDFDATINKLKLEFFFPKLSVGKTQIESGKVLLQNPQEKMFLEVLGKTFDKKKNKVDINLLAEARNDTVSSSITFNNNDTLNNLSGSVKFLTAFEKKWEESLKTVVQFVPSTFVLDNDLIHINPSEVEILSGVVSVNHFSLEGEKERIRINGVYSKTSYDTLYVDLYNTNLRIVEMITNNTKLDFGGFATGQASVIGKEKGLPVLFTNLLVNDFAYNKAPLGKLEIFGKWDEVNQGILMDGKILQENELPTTIYGHIFPTKDSLDLLFDTNHLNLKLLDPFVKNVMDDFSGWGYGKVHMFGNFKRLNFVGAPYVKDASFGVDFLNTKYAFSDTLYLTPKAFQLKQTTIFDGQGNRAIVDASINHHFFDDITYEVSLRTANLHVYNADQKQNPIFYGSVYGSGTAMLRGDLDRLYINVNMRSERNSKLTLSFFDNITASTLNFVTFVEKEKKPDVDAEKPPQEEKSEFEIVLNLAIQATPDVTVQLVVDPQTGDILTGSGTGLMNLTYNSRSEDITLYGTYSIDNGNYSFNWEEIIKKDFSIRNGSTVSFRGDPYDALLDVTAVYSLTADISSLEYSLGEESGRQNVPVDVVIHIAGNLEHPDITPSIELPSSGDDIRRKVNSLIYTQNDMTKQVFYLLLFSQFNSPDQVSVSNSNSAQLASVVSSTLSSQLNSFLSQVSNRINIGTSIQSKNRGGFQDLEVGLNISTKMFDDRVIFKSNLGYRDNMYQSNNFIGDFDLEYKLTRSGDIRLKAYSHYNDNSIYYGRSGLTTQGIGIMYTKDFSRLSELLRQFERRRPAEPNPNVPAVPSSNLPVVQPERIDSISVSLPNE